MRYKYTDEQITEAVKRSMSVLDVMQVIGASVTAGGVRNHVSRRIQALGVDTSHFVPYSVDIGDRRKASTNAKLSAEALLVRRASGLQTKTVQLRRAMVESGIPYECH